jgi:hypothetical protein
MSFARRPIISAPPIKTKPSRLRRATNARGNPEPAAKPPEPAEIELGREGPSVLEVALDAALAAALAVALDAAVPTLLGPAAAAGAL